MDNRKLLVGITQGDANGIGYEVIIKALSDSRIFEQFTPVVYGSSKAFGFYKNMTHNTGNTDTYVINSAKDAMPGKINIVNCLKEDIYVEPGRSTPESAKSAIESLEFAVKDIKNKEIDVLVTAPINKNAMAKEGFGYTGHTEYLKKEFNSDRVAMIMASESLKVGVVTGHIALKEVAETLTTGKILEKLEIIKTSMQKDFAIGEPKIGVLGLNPHCGDYGLLGDEEKNIIIPAVKQANEKGIAAFGPFSPDGYFGLSNYRNFDITLAMYHDQGLIPFKALNFETGVNFTAGLPIIRTSPDHGTAYNLAGKDTADPMSMRSAIYMAVDIFKRRTAFEEVMKNRIDEKYLTENNGYKNRNGRNNRRN